MMGERPCEVKITYRDGDTARAIRGVIVSEDDFFIELERRDGTMRIGKASVIKIEDRGFSDERES
jgi:hypothetical protein